VVQHTYNKEVIRTPSTGVFRRLTRGDRQHDRAADAREFSVT
jgi:hypothetical protein